MDARAVAWRRLAIVAAAVTAAAVLVMPAAALGKAKAATRFVVASQTVVDWSSGSSATTPVISVKLQKKSGTKWVALRGPIKAYYLDPSTSAWVLAGSITGSNVTLTMPYRGRYRLTYGGSSTAKAATAYPVRIDTIGEVISPVSATFDVSDVDHCLDRIRRDVEHRCVPFGLASPDRVRILGLVRGQRRGRPALLGRRVLLPAAVGTRYRAVLVPHPQVGCPTGRGGLAAHVVQHECLVR
jgi:hypothetical protein